MEPLSSNYELWRMSIKEILGIIYVENLIFIVSFSTEGSRDHISASMGLCLPAINAALP